MKRLISFLTVGCVGWQSLSSVSVTSIVDGLKKLYIEKLKPLEVTYRFNDFVSPTLVLPYCILIYIYIYSASLDAVNVSECGKYRM